MKLPLIIGNNSAGENYIIDLELLPHLFISYHEEQQLTSIFMQWAGDFIGSGQAAQLAISLGSKLAEMMLPLLDETKIILQFTHSQIGNSNVHSIDEFVSALITQLKTRKTLKRDKRKESAIIIFIDDIFQIIRSANKKTAFSFIDLLLNGPEQSIHIIAGASGIYKTH